MNRRQKYKNYVGFYKTIKFYPVLRKSHIFSISWHTSSPSTHPYLY